LFAPEYTRAYMYKKALARNISHWTFTLHTIFNDLYHTLQFLTLLSQMLSFKQSQLFMNTKPLSLHGQQAYILKISWY